MNSASHQSPLQEYLTFQVRSERGSIKADKLHAMIHVIVAGVQSLPVGHRSCMGLKTHRADRWALWNSLPTLLRVLLRIAKRGHHQYTATLRIARMSWTPLGSHPACNCVGFSFLGSPGHWRCLVAEFCTWSGAVFAMCGDTWCAATRVKRQDLLGPRVYG